jgi:hypothetical protein
MKLSSKAVKSYKKAQSLFNIEKNNYNLKDAMNKALLPNILFFGTYQQELVYICNIEKTLTRNGEINFSKFILINEVMKRMYGSKMYPYEFKRNENILVNLKTMPDKDRLESA